MEPPRVSLRLVAGEWYLAITTDSSYASALQIQQLPRPSWDSDSNTWLVPYSPLALFHLLTLWPEAKLDDNLAAVRLRLGLAKRDMACPGTPSPDLPQGLFEYQRDATLWIRQRGGNVILADAPGLGKSATTIAAVRNWLPALVIAPSSAKIAWKNEIKRWAQAEARLIEHRRGGIGPEPWAIISYDLVQPHQRQLLAKLPQTIILDEAQHIRHTETKHARAVLAIATRVEKTIAISATPVLSYMAELFSMLVAIKALGYADRRYYEATFCGSPTRFRNRLIYKGASNTALLRDFLSSVLLRRTREEVGQQLGAVHRVVLTVQPRDLALYQQEATLTRGWLQGGGVTAPLQNKLVRLNRLRQIAALGKAAVVLTDIHNCLEAGHKVLIFSEFLDALRYLHAIFPAAVFFTGSLTASQRAAAIERFQTDPDCTLALISSRAGGEAITLTKASVLFILCPPWTPAEVTQMIGRVNRIGQQFELTAYITLAPGTVDEPMVATLVRKANVVESLLGPGTVDAEILAAVESHLLAA